MTILYAIYFGNAKGNIEKAVGTVAKVKKTRLGQSAVEKALQLQSPDWSVAT